MHQSATMLAFIRDTKFVFSQTNPAQEKINGLVRSTGRGVEEMVSLLLKNDVAAFSC